jgi:hypothetical protein
MQNSLNLIPMTSAQTSAQAQHNNTTTRPAFLLDNTNKCPAKRIVSSPIVFFILSLLIEASRSFELKSSSHEARHFTTKTRRERNSSTNALPASKVFALEAL